MITAKKDQERDVAFMGLKTVIIEASPANASAMTAACIAPLLQGLRSDTADVASNCLDALVELIARHGAVLPSTDVVIEALLPELDHSRGGIRKRSIQCLALLAVSLPQEKLNALYNELLGRLESAHQSEKSRRQTVVHALGAMNRKVGYKIGGQQLSTAIPLVLDQLNKTEEGDDELMELCLAALEACVERSPGNVRPFLGDVTEACLRYMKYDPNYDDMDGGGEDMADDDNSGVDEEEEEEDEPYSDDDDDTSWKVRRAAAKLAGAVVGQYTDMLMEVYRTLGPALVARFNEREEAVRPDVYQAYTDLVAAIGALARRGDGAPVEALSTDVPAVLRVLSRQLRNRSPKTRASALKALQQLVRAVPAPVVAHVGTAIISGVKAALEDDSSSGALLKIEALHFINAALSSCCPRSLQMCLAPSLGPSIFAAASERYYAVATEGLRACERMIRVLRPDPLEDVPPELAVLVQPLFDVAKEKLMAQDQSQEVKDAAISCVAAAIAALSDVLDGGEGGGGASQVCCSPRCQSLLTRIFVLKWDLPDAMGILGMVF